MAKVITHSRGLRKDGSSKMPKVILVSEKQKFTPTAERKDGYVNRKDLRNFRTGRTDRIKVAKKSKFKVSPFTMGAFNFTPSYTPKHQKVKGWMRNNKGKFINTKER